MDVSPEEGARRAVASWQSRGWLDCTRAASPARNHAIEIAVAHLLRTLQAEVKRRMLAKAPGLRLGNSPYVQLDMTRLRTAVISPSTVDAPAILDSAARMIAQLDERLRSELRSAATR